MCIYGHKVEKFSQEESPGIVHGVTWLQGNTHQSLWETTDLIISCFDSIGSHEH